MNRVSRFFKLVGFETKRVLRNKAVGFFLMAFSLILILLLFALQTSESRYAIAVLDDGVEVEKTEIYEDVSHTLKNRLIYVDSEEEGIDMIRKREVSFFFRFYHADENNPTTMVFYYDEANRFARGLAYDVRAAAEKSAYEGIVSLIESYGVVLNESYFEPVSIKPISKVFRYDQLAFVAEVAVSISLVLMLGLAYAIARDRETKVSENLCYLPLGRNEYLLAKLVPFFVLGMIEMLIVLILGVTIMDIVFKINLLLVWLLSSIFVMAVLSLGLLFATMRSQISAAFFSILTIILPVFLSILMIIESRPLYVQIFCYLLPIIPFMQLAEGMIYNGMVIWWDIPILIVHAIGYYLAAYFLIKKRT